MVAVGEGELLGFGDRCNACGFMRAPAPVTPAKGSIRLSVWAIVVAPEDGGPMPQMFRAR